MTPLEPAIIRIDSSKEIYPREKEIYETFFTSGFLIVEFSKKELPHEQLLCFKQLFGQTIPHDRSDEFMIAEISPSQLSPDYLGTSTEEHFFHTDGSYLQHPPPVVLLRCEIAAKHGGETIVVDSLDMIEKCFRNHRDEFWALCEPDALCVNRAGSISTLPVFSTAAGRINVRYRFDFTTSIPDQPLIRSGFDIIQSYLQDVQHVHCFKLLPNQVLILDNLRILHGRKAFSPNEPRKLHRLFFDGSPLPSPRIEPPTFANDVRIPK